MPETLKFDPKTYDWMQGHEWAEITVTKCDKCGMHYKPDLGHVCDKKSRLEFNRVIGNIEVRACPSDLGMPCKDKPNETIEVVMWHKDSNGKPYCFTIAYFEREKEGYSLHFVGARPFLYLTNESVPELCEAMNEAQCVLDAWFYDTEGMKDE